MGKRVTLVLTLAITCVVHAHAAWAQSLGGALIGIVKDAQGAVLSGAVVRVSSPALIGGAHAMSTNDRGQLRFPALPPGVYVLDIEVQGFKAYHEDSLRIGIGATVERTVVLDLVNVKESVTVQGARLGDRGARQWIRDQLRP